MGILDAATAEPTTDEVAQTPAVVEVAAAPDVPEVSELPRDERMDSIDENGALTAEAVALRRAAQD